MLPSCPYKGLSAAKGRIFVDSLPFQPVPVAYCMVMVPLGMARRIWRSTSVARGVTGQEKGLCVTVDIDALREYLRDYYGTALFAGFTPALLDLADLDRMSGNELCRLAERLGVDLHRFEVR